MTETGLRPLTGSGMGRVLETDEPDPDGLAALIAEAGFVVLRGACRALGDANRVMSGLGPLVKHDKRKDGVLELDGTKDEEEVLRGREFMPLHADGLGMGIDVRIVGIFCQEFRSVRDGRTFVSDTAGALPALPAETRAVLAERGIELQPVDTSYYTIPGDRWHCVPAIVDGPRGPALSMGFPYRPGRRASWRARLPGLPAEESDQRLFELEALLLDPRYAYFHDWVEGDLLLIDNKSCLHGREAYEGQRTLHNLQVR